jgi:hypothetical protein
MKTIYWSSTIILSAYLLLSAYTYFFNKNTIEGIKALGFPDFFRIELAVLKIVAAIILLLPIVPFQIKQWAYAGAALFLVTAIVAHIAHKDSVAITIINLLLLAILVVSNYTLHRMAT